MGLQVTIGRIFNTIGRRQTGEWGMVLPTFVAQALAGDLITVHGTGEQRRDTVEGLIGLLSSDDAVGGVFNIGNEREVTVMDLDDG